MAMSRTACLAAFAIIGSLLSGCLAHDTEDLEVKTKDAQSKSIQFSAVRGLLKILFPDVVKTDEAISSRMQRDAFESSPPWWRHSTRYYPTGSVFSTVSPRSSQSSEAWWKSSDYYSPSTSYTRRWWQSTRNYYGSTSAGINLRSRQYSTVSPNSLPWSRRPSYYTTSSRRWSWYSTQTPGPYRSRQYSRYSTVSPVPWWRRSSDYVSGSPGSPTGSWYPTGTRDYTSTVEPPTVLPTKQPPPPPTSKPSVIANYFINVFCLACQDFLQVAQKAVPKLDNGLLQEQLKP